VTILTNVPWAIQVLVDYKDTYLAVKIENPITNKEDFMVRIDKPEGGWKTLDFKQLRIKLSSCIKQRQLSYRLAEFVGHEVGIKPRVGLDIDEKDIVSNVSSFPGSILSEVASKLGKAIKPAQERLHQA
jgi:hypothetical protein